MRPFRMDKGRGKRKGFHRDGKGRGKRAKRGTGPGLCFAFKKGECTRGDQCRFQHGTEAATKINHDDAERAKASTPMNGGNVTPATRTPNPNRDKRKKTKVALVISYNGAGYHGSQINHGMPTIEQELWDALVSAKAIGETDIAKMSQVSWTRCARTDKGVHAAANVVALKLYHDPPPVEAPLKPASPYPPAISKASAPPATPGVSSATTAASTGSADSMASTANGGAAAGHSTSTEDNLDQQQKLNAVIKRVNQLLPKGRVRITGILPVQKGFHAKNSASSRQYFYTVPSFAFMPFRENVANKSFSGIQALKAWRKETDYKAFTLNDARKENINKILGSFLGTKNYHNFTKMREATDPSCYRFIDKFEIDGVFTYEGVEFVRLVVHGASFMLNQIRKMVGMAICVARGLVEEDVLMGENASIFEKQRRRLPIAPALGLLLDRPIFAGYAKKVASCANDKKPISHMYEQAKGEITGFRDQYITPAVCSEEIKESATETWLENLHDNDDSWGEIIIDKPPFPSLEGAIASASDPRTLEDLTKLSNLIGNLDATSSSNAPAAPMQGIKQEEAAAAPSIAVPIPMEVVKMEGGGKQGSEQQTAKTEPTPSSTIPTEDIKAVVFQLSKENKKDFESWMGRLSDLNAAISRKLMKESSAAEQEDKQASAQSYTDQKNWLYKKKQFKNKRDIRQQEKKKERRMFVKQEQAKIRMLVEVSESTQQDAVELIQYAQKMGASAVILKTPLWTAPSSIQSSGTERRGAVLGDEANQEGESEQVSQMTVNAFEKGVLKACYLVGKHVPKLPFFFKPTGEQALVSKDESSACEPIIYPGSSSSLPSQGIRLSPFAYHSNNLFPNLVGFLIEWPQNPPMDEQSQTMKEAALSMGKTRRVHVHFMEPTGSSH